MNLLVENGPLTIAASPQEFVDVARRASATSDCPERLTWYQKHFDTRMLDAQLLEIVPGPA
jgi:hypothetical protein